MLSNGATLKGGAPARAPDMVNTTGIHNAVAHARRRLRLQSSLDWATLSVIVASALATVAIYLGRRELISTAATIAAVAACVGGVIVAGIVGYLRRFSVDFVAARIDRASGLNSRLANACAFEQQLSADDKINPETAALMMAAIADGARAAPRADVVAATPVSAPRDWKLAAGFVVGAAIISSLAIPPPEKLPAITDISPSEAARGTSVTVTGTRLCGPSETGDIPCTLDAQDGLFLGEGSAAVALEVDSWSASSISFTVPELAPIGVTTLSVHTRGRRSKTHRFEVLADDDPRATPQDLVVLEDEDLEYTRDLVAELRQTGEANEDLELVQFADEVQELLDQTERGELSKKQLLEALARLEEKYMQGSQEGVEEAMSDLKKTGAELKKSPQTKDLGKALEKGDLDKAKQELEKLANNIDNDKLSEKDKAQVAKAMEAAAKKLEKLDEQRKKQADKQFSKQEQQINELKRRLQKETNEQKKEELARRLQRKKRELKRLRREREKREESQSKRELKRLRRDMKQAAEQLRKRTQKSRRQVSRTMRDMARRAGKVDRDRRKMANRPKATTQMGDLKEALRRAKRRGKNGPKNRFGRNRRNRDFQKRAQGGQGQKGAWKPGQKGGKGNKGKGGKQPGGQGKKPGGDQYGTGHDPNLMGDPTAKSGKTTDESLQGVHGQGASTRETILTSAQKGFASRSYKNVYTRYKKIVGDVVSSEKVPSGYKYYVKKYFQKIKPHEM